MSEELAQGLRDTAKWIRSKDPLATNYLFCLQAAAILSAPPAPQPDREAIAQAIDPAAWDQRARHLNRAMESLDFEDAERWEQRARDAVAASLRKADAVIATLSSLSPKQEVDHGG